MQREDKIAAKLAIKGKMVGGTNRWGCVRMKECKNMVSLRYLDAIPSIPTLSKTWTTLCALCLER